MTIYLSKKNLGLRCLKNPKISDVYQIQFSCRNIARWNLLACEHIHWIIVIIAQFSSSFHSPTQLNRQSCCLFAPKYYLSHKSLWYLLLSVSADKIRVSCFKWLNIHTLKFKVDAPTWEIFTSNWRDFRFKFLSSLMKWILFSSVYLRIYICCLSCADQMKL